MQHIFTCYSEKMFSSVLFFVFPSIDVNGCRGVEPTSDVVEQGSQTQMDSRAAWDSKLDLAGCIEKVKKKLLKILCFSQYIVKNRQKWPKIFS